LKRRIQKRGWQLVRLRILRWLTISLPILFFIGLELFEDFVLEPKIGRWPAHLVAFILVGSSATLLTIIVFRAFERIENLLRLQNRELAVLNEVSRVISGSLEIDEILSLSLDKVLDVTNSEAGEIFLLDADTNALVFKFHKGLFPEAFREITSFKAGSGIPGLVLQSGQEIIVSDLQSETRFKRRELVKLGFQSFVCVPLCAKDRVVGVMSIADRHQIYDKDSASLLSAIGNQIGLALENARLYTQAEEARGYLNGMIESSGDAIITTYLDGCIRSWNHAAEEIYGWKADEVINQYLPMVPEHLQDELEDIIARLKQGETIRNLETERLHKSGRLISVVVTASPVRDTTGNIIGLLGISKDISENKRLQAEIAHQKQSVAVLEERERIAREMHDGLAQVLGYVNTKAQAVHRFLEVKKFEEAEAHLTQLEEAARAVYADVREAILGLRTPIGDNGNLMKILEDYLSNFEQQSNIKTALHIATPSLFDEFELPVEVQLIRIVQEALTNVRKHSQAQSVCIKFERVHHFARITIEDDGQGFNTQAVHYDGEWPRFGLQTMRERAEGVDGSLTIHSVPGSGTRICVTLPLSKKEDSDG